MHTEVCPSSNELSTRAVDSRTEVVEIQRVQERRAKQRAPLLLTSPEKAAVLRALLAADRSTATQRQRDRLVEAMRQTDEVTVLEARRFLDIQHAPARILNLDQAGYTIARRQVRQTTEAGVLHRTVAYSIAAWPEAN